MISYLSDDSILCKADKIGPGRVVDILKDCGSFDPGSSPGRGVKKVLRLIFLLMSSADFLFNFQELYIFLGLSELLINILISPAEENFLGKLTMRIPR